MKIYEVMQSKVFTANENDKVSTIIKLMADKNIGFVVIVDKKKPIGVITDRDIVLSLVSGITLEHQINKVMKRYVLSINQNEDVSNASDMMGYMQVKRLVVTNDFDELSGVISIADLARNVFTEEYAFEALTEISYDYSTIKDKNSNNMSISAFMV